MERDLIRDVNQDPDSGLARYLRIMPALVFILGILTGVALAVGVWPDVRHARIRWFNLVPGVILFAFGSACAVFSHRVLKETARRLKERNSKP